MRVLHLNAGNLFGGIESYLLTLARYRHLAPNMEPYFGLCFSGRLRDELKASGVPVYDLGAVRLSRPWTVLRARRRLKALLQSAGFDAVVSHGCWPHAIFAAAVKSSGVRLINAVHGDLSHPNSIDRWAARTVPDLVIANSRFTARPAAKLFQGSTVEVLYLPVPCPDIGDRLATSSRIRAELSTPNDATVILMVSRIEKSKGHAILLDALRDLQEVPGWFAWVVGGAQKQSEIELLRQLRRTAEQLGLYERFRFAGPRNDIADVMTAANIYCQPNTGPEGFGLTFVEALYAQLPVVTSGFGGAIEIVDETCGVLTPPGDSIAVAEALKGLINSPVRRQALGGSGPCRASHLCDPARHLDRLTMLAS